MNRLFNSKEFNLNESVVTVLFEILVSEALTLFLYSIVSIFTLHSHPIQHISMKGLIIMKVHLFQEVLLCA
jgi:hypothetical protein